MVSDRILEHLKNPHNMGKMDRPDGVGKIGDTICEDELNVYIRVEDGKIVDAGFEGFACAAAIVTSSVATDLAKGKTPEEILKMTKEDVIKELGEVPGTKMKCLDLGSDGVKAAVRDYLSKKK